MSSTEVSARLIALRDQLLALENTVIDQQQTLQRAQKAGELLEALTFWPSPTADQNVARDIGRVLQGKPADRSTGVEEALHTAGCFTRSWKQRAEQAEAKVTELEGLITALRQDPPV